MIFQTWFSRRLSKFRATSWSYKAKSAGWKCLHVVNFACVLHLISEHIGRLTLMEGPSMMPTLGYEGEIAVEDRITYRLFPDRLRRGDLVVVQSPIQPGHIICKRILGMPGDIVCVDPTGEHAPSTEHVKIPPGHVWISGDNAAYSRDSRMYGPVSMSLIQGRLYARVWPLRSATIFRNPATVLD